MFPTFNWASRDTFRTLKPFSTLLGFPLWKTEFTPVSGDSTVQQIALSLCVIKLPRTRAGRAGCPGPQYISLTR